MDKKNKEKMSYPESGAAQSVLWTDIPLHSQEVQLVETVAKGARSKHETHFITRAEVHSPRDIGVKNAQKSGHREKRAKSRTREQMLISEQSCHRRSRHISKTGNYVTKDPDQSQFLKNRDSTTGAKYRDLDHNFQLRKSHNSESGEQPYNSGQSSYLRNRDIFESGGEEPVNFFHGHCTESTKYMETEVKQSRDRRQDHHFDATDRLFSPKNSKNTSTIGKNTKRHKLGYIGQNQHFKQNDEVVGNWGEQLSYTDNSHSGEKGISEKESMSLNPNIFRQDPESKKLTNTKGDKLDLKDNPKLASKRTFKIEDQSVNPRFHERKGLGVGEGDMETSFSETRSPESCSDITRIITKSESTATAQVGPLSRRWNDIKERMGQWWRDSLCQRNLKKYLLFYVITAVVGLICIVLSTKVSVDLMDIPLSISMVCFVCCVATFVCERGCLLAYLEFKKLLDETIPHHDHGFNYRLCSDCIPCCTKQISPGQPRSRRRRSEVNTAFKHEVADVSQISATEYPHMRVVANEDFDCSASPNDSPKSSKIIAAVVHFSETGDESELEDDKSDDTDALLVRSSDDVSASIYEEDVPSLYTSTDDVSSSIYEYDQAGELEHVPLLEKEIQKSKSYLSTSGDDNAAFIPKAALAKSDGNAQNVLNPEQDASRKKKSDSCGSFVQTSSYYVYNCENCGKEVVGSIFSKHGGEMTGGVDHECEKKRKTVNPAVASWKSRADYKDNSRRFSSDDDVYICEHFGQPVACGCAEILLKSKSNKNTK